MSIKIINLIFENFDGSREELLCMLALARWGNDEGKNIYPSVATIGRYLRLSESQTHRTLAKLVKKTYLTVVEPGGGHHGTTRQYAINLALLCNKSDAGNQQTGRTDATGSADATRSAHASDGSHPCVTRVASMRVTGSADATQSVRTSTVRKATVRKAGVGEILPLRPLLPASLESEPGAAPQRNTAKPKVNGKRHPKVAEPEPVYSQDFEAFLVAFPKQAYLPKKDAHIAWTKRLQEGHSAADMIAGARRYAKWLEAAPARRDVTGRPLQVYPHSAEAFLEHHGLLFTLRWELNDSSAEHRGYVEAMEREGAKLGIARLDGEDIHTYAERVNKVLRKQALGMR